MSSPESLNLSLPPSMQEWIQQLISQGAVGSAGDYVRQLILEDQERRWHAEVEKKLLEALASGPAEEMTREDWARLREAARLRLKKAQQGSAA